jgi:hypothetical protein
MNSDSIALEIFPRNTQPFPVNRCPKGVPSFIVEMNLKPEKPGGPAVPPQPSAATRFGITPKYELE